MPEVVLGELVWLDNIQDNIRYEACVTDIDVRKWDYAVLGVSLRLPDKFYSYEERFALNSPDNFYSYGERFALGFRHNRLTLRRQYHALVASFSPSRRLLFPSVSDIKPNIRDDDQQLQAVVSILEQPQGSVPFIIYGPPGTGKTSVVVESIVQLVRRDGAVRVLVCTPSDAATDLLAKRLATAGLGPGGSYRLPNTSSKKTMYW
ncbi:hypothetical protein BC827DRAFT_504602 [Russula dissimulans]|nr:hypothetical protein BC827DRAFT_504602 [Russula dissimulans]